MELMMLGRLKCRQQSH